MQGQVVSLPAPVPAMTRRVPARARFTAALERFIVLNGYESTPTAVKAVLHHVTFGVAAQGSAGLAGAAGGIPAWTHTVNSALHSCLCPLRCRF